MTLDADGNEIEEIHETITANQGMQALFAHRDEDGNEVIPAVFDERAVFEEQVLPLVNDLMTKCADLNLPIVCMVQFQRTRSDEHQSSEGIMFAVSNPNDLRAGTLHRGIVALIASPSELTIQPTISSLLGSVNIEDLFLGGSGETDDA